MSNNFSRRKILKIAGGFVAGAGTAWYLPSIANPTGSSNKGQTELTTEQIKQLFPSPTVNNRIEFVGPFPSWRNLKTNYNATGDGITDDTNALQQALNELGSSNQSHVLYLPAGTYRITRGLTMISPMNISIIGEDPDTTTIKWDGPQNGTILYLNGVRYSKFSRLKFDGSGRAAIAIDQSWDGTVPGFDTGNEYSDSVFQDVGYGIQGGNLGHGAAESAVLRCRFIRNSKAGVVTKNFNALDWFIWYSVFTDCNVGVTNEPGAGNFHVFESVFFNSKTADVLIKNTMYFSIRNNFSLNSKAFFLATFVGRNAALTTIQGNTIIDPLDSPAIRIENLGPVLLIDNTIRTRAGATGPVVQFRPFEPGDFVSVGNKYTVNNAEDITGRYLTLDNTVVAASSISATIPSLPGTLAQRNRQVFEVPAGASAAVIQQAINAAATKNGNRPVVHLPAGTYQIDTTVVIPANRDLQLVGDGDKSVLVWAGNSTGPVLQLEGPSRATLRDFMVNGASKGNGILVKNANQLQSRVLMEQVFLINAMESSLVVDKLDYTNVDLRNFYHAGSKGTSVKVIGGQGAASGISTGGRTNIFSGAASNNVLSYAVSNGAKLLARDIWYEDARMPGFAVLTGKGTFTIHGSRFLTPVNQPTPAVEINNFDGTATFLTSVVDDRIVVNGSSTNTNVLALGLQGNSDTYLVNNSASSQVALLHSRKFGQNGSVPVANQGNEALIAGGTETAAFIRKMLAHTRNERPKQLTSLIIGTTDLVFDRVRVESSLVGIRLQA